MLNHLGEAEFEPRGQAAKLMLGARLGDRRALCLQLSRKGEMHRTSCGVGSLISACAMWTYSGGR